MRNDNEPFHYFELPALGEVVFFDLELTSWQGSLRRMWGYANEHMEIIQIGAVRVSLDRNWKEIACLNSIVLPIINKKLSGYITELTNITQSRLQTEGIPATDAISMFGSFCEGAVYVISNGNDRFAIDETCRLNGVKSQNLPYINVEPFIREALQKNEQVLSCDLGKELGFEENSAPHDALADARQVASAVKELTFRSRRGGR